MAEDKIFKYKGKTIEELKSMSLDELKEIFPSDLRRKISRGFTEQENKLLAKIKAKEKNIKTHSRDMIVLPEMIGNKISIHTGKEFQEILLIPEMVGLRLGQLALTRKIATHTTLNKK